MPFRLGVLSRLGDAEDVAGGSHEDDDLPAPEYKPGQPAAEQARPVGALNDVEGRRQKRGTAKGEDHRVRMKRTKPPKSGPGQVEVQRREGKLPCDDIANQEPDDAPNHRRDDGVLDDIVGIRVLIDGFSAAERFASQENGTEQRKNSDNTEVQLEHWVRRF